MAKLIIRGGRRLAGRHTVPGNKNAALPMLAATLLTPEPVTLRNLPRIRDVQSMLEILEHLGADIRLDGNCVTVCTRNCRKRVLPPALCSQVRSSILFAGPMAARFGRVRLAPPGGDIIGRRRLDTHFEALHQLGVRAQGTREFALQVTALRPARILLDEASVTATENTVMTAVRIPGRTTIFNAACEPHVQDLCRMLNRMGARIHGIGTNYLRIDGVDALRGAEYAIQPDYIDALSFVAACAVTGGELVIPNASLEGLDVPTRAFRKLGMRWKFEDRRLVLPAGQKLRIQNDLGAAIPKIEDGTWPNFPSDLMSVAIVVATQARGTVLFFEKMFESRMYFVDRLIDMGARIVQCDPHRVIVTGPAQLRGLRLSSPDIRAGMAMVLAALAARGETVIENAQTIDRGYENVVENLRALGADIERGES